MGHQHRNPGKTATTHVKSAAGLWRVHDGGEIRATIVDPATGKELCDLTYDDARRMKDYAVTKLKQRRAGIERMQYADDPVESAAPAPVVRAPTPKIPVIAKPKAAPFAGEGNPSLGDDSLDLDLPAVPEIKKTPPPPKAVVLSSTDKPNPDPYLEGLRQASLRAARPAAIEAQQRADKIKQQKEMLRAAGIDPDNPNNSKRGAMLPKDPNHPKSPIVGLDAVDAQPQEDNNADGGEDVENMMATGAKTEKTDAQRAKEQADADAAAAEAAGREIYARESVGAAGMTMKPPTWEKLPESMRAEYRWRGMNEHDLRVGDFVAFYTEATEDERREAQESVGQPVDLKVMINLAMIVRVFDKNTINLQLGADVKKKTADGKIILNVKRLPDGLDPMPNTWLPAVAARGIGDGPVNMLELLAQSEIEDAEPVVEPVVTDEVELPDPTPTDEPIADEPAVSS